MLTAMSYKQLALLAGDLLLILASAYLAPAVRFGVLIDPSLIFGPSDVIVILAYLSVLYLFDFYRLNERPLRSGFIIRLAVALFAANFIGASLFYLFGLRPYGTSIMLISGFLTLLSLLLWRVFFVRFFVDLVPEKILILGAGKTGTSLYEFLKPIKDFELVGFVDDDPEKQNLTIGHAPVLGTTSDLVGILRGHHVQTVVVGVMMKRSIEVFKRLVEAKFSGVDVYEMAAFYEKYLGVIPVLYTTNMWLGFADISGVKKNIYNTKLKRILDKILALSGLILALPLILLLAALIKLESKGPVFYKQTRVGWDEKPFELYKFRSMRADAEKEGAVWAQENDPRITRVGRVIRPLRMDELPQLWNVLVDDMSFVGPRPERPEFVETLKAKIPYYTLRHSVKPGITGWAQVNYPYGATVKDALAKLEYDLYYIKNTSPLSDLIILVRTVKTVLLGTGAR